MVRIFNLPQGEKLYTLKRGMQRVEVYWLSFSHKSDLVTLSSNSGTIHLFKLERKEEGSQEVVQ